MAAHAGTLIKPTYNSSNAYDIDWSSFDSGANNITFDVDGVDASKMIILVAQNGTIANYVWVGTSDSRSSHTSMSYPYSAGGLPRYKIGTTACGDGNAKNRFQTTVAADTEVVGIIAIGPFETARFKDSNGQINVCRGKTAAETLPQYIAAILIP